MSGVKASLAGAPESADADGKPAANAGRNEPSIDEILASIRQVISEQNRQADEAVAKAAAEVANNQQNSDKIESIIGPMSAVDLSANSAPKPQAGEVKAPEIVVSDNVKTVPATKVEPKAPVGAGKNSAHLTELEELIQLIGSSPAAPRPSKNPDVDGSKDAGAFGLKAETGIAAQSTSARSVEVKGQVNGNNAINPVSQPAPNATEKNSEKQPPISIFKVFRRGEEASNKKSAVVLPKENDSEIRREAVEPKGPLHPSISPKSAVPQVIKDAMGQMPGGDSGDKPNAKPDSSTNEPAVVSSHKSALDRLLARKNKAAPKPDVSASPATQPQSSFAQPTQAPAAAKAGNAASAPVSTPMQPSPATNAKASASPVVPAHPTPAPISSREINAAVIKSIDRLATSMFADRKAEIDGMMAGLMRPMLQEWLEDNLSSLVERIVREEIERVSRGTHQ